MMQIGTAIAGVFAWFASLFGAPSAALPLPVSSSIVPPAREASILFVGDMMFDRTVRLAMQNDGDDYILSCIKDTLESADVVVGNLEGPITEYQSKSLGSEIGSPDNFTFTFPTSTAFMLKRHNIGLVSLANNHATNFGGDGIVQTKEWLARAGVRHFGDPFVSENDRVARVEKGGLLFSFIGWSDWTGGTSAEVLAQIETEASTGRRVIVMAHWGEEYSEPTANQRALARRFVDAGAKLVIGAHPHVVQEREFYKGVPIYYSLGNFVFDQYWNEDVRTGLLVRVMFDEEGIYGIDEFATYLESDRRTCLKDT